MTVGEPVDSPTPNAYVVGVTIVEGDTPPATDEPEAVDDAETDEPEPEVTAQG